MPINQQDYIIRLKLLGWKFEYLQEQLEKISSVQTQPLILQLGFWIYSAFTWISAGIFKRILDHFTQIKIIPWLFKKLNARAK